MLHIWMQKKKKQWNAVRILYCTATQTTFELKPIMHDTEIPHIVGVWCFQIRNRDGVNEWV